MNEPNTKRTQPQKRISMTNKLTAKTSNRRRSKKTFRRHDPRAVIAAPGTRPHKITISQKQLKQQQQLDCRLSDSLPIADEHQSMSARENSPLYELLAGCRYNRKDKNYGSNAIIKLWKSRPDLQADFRRITVRVCGLLSIPTRWLDSRTEGNQAGSATEDGPTDDAIRALWQSSPDIRAEFQRRL